MECGSIKTADFQKQDVIVGEIAGTFWDGRCLKNKSSK
jgi:hypothetical protein